MRNLGLTAALVFFSFMGAARAVEESETLWKSWPNNSPKCSQELLNDYFNSNLITKFDYLYKLSICSHSKVGDLKDFAYAVSQLGGSEEGAIRSVTNFANKISQKPDIWNFCITYAGVTTKDGNNYWRSIVTILIELTQNMEKFNAKCLDISQ
jgi:hypothetical protein